MKRILLSLALVFVTGNLVAAEANKAISLRDLLDQVKKEGTLNSAINKKREREFRASKNRQAALLADAKKQFAYENARSKRLVKQFSENTKTLETLTDDLRVKSGNIGLMNGVVRSVANDSSARFTNSLISSQYPNRSKLMDALAQSKRLPELPDFSSPQAKAKGNNAKINNIINKGFILINCLDIFLFIQNS